MNFGAISEARKLVMATYDMCAVCGCPFGESDLHWQVHLGERPGDLSECSVVDANEAPVHRICALYAAQACPFVSSPYARLGDEVRKAQQRGHVVVLAGYRSPSDVTVISSALQARKSILMFGMTGLAETLELSSAAEAAEAYRETLEADGPVEVDEPTAMLIHQLSEPVIGEDPSAVMGGRRLLDRSGVRRGSRQGRRSPPLRQGRCAPEDCGDVSS